MNDLSWNTKDGLRLHAYEWPIKTDPQGVIAIVHGLGEHCNRYYHMADFFNQNGFPVIGFDARGHGKSGGQRGHAPDYDFLLDDIEILLFETKKRYPEIPLFLYGHSLGGQHVLSYALNRHGNISGVISSAPWLAPAIPLPAWKTLLGKLMYNLMPTFSLASGLEVDALSHDLSVVEGYRKDPLVHSIVSAKFGIDFMTHGLALINTSPTKFPYPLLISWGSLDRLSSIKAIQQFATKMKGDIEQKEWVGLYHEIHNEPENQAVFQFILDWIKRHSEKGLTQSVRMTTIT